MGDADRFKSPKPKAFGKLSSQMDTTMDDPLNMSIHSRMNVWENKIKDSEQEKSSATPQSSRHESGMYAVLFN